LTPTLPFLYLPDAITLILLLVSFVVLRSVAVDHLRQELLIMRKEMLVHWMKNGLNHNESGYVALANLIDTSIRLAPKLSPGRLAFVYRLQKAFPFPDPSREVSRLIETTANANGREKLKRLQLEMNLGLGTFFCIGSLSGCFLLLVHLPRILKRAMSHHSENRTDFFFDMVERVLASIGRRAQQIGFAAQQYHLPSI
jgi:hypothetical protein